MTGSDVDVSLSRSFGVLRGFGRRLSVAWIPESPVSCYQSPCRSLVLQKASLNRTLCPLVNKDRWGEGKVTCGPGQWLNNAIRPGGCSGTLVIRIGNRQAYIAAMGGVTVPIAACLGAA